MKGRIDEIAEFYDSHLDDPKAQFFEKLRLQLKKALMTKYVP